MKTITLGCPKSTVNLALGLPAGTYGILEQALAVHFENGFRNSPLFIYFKIETYVTYGSAQ